MKTDYYFIGIGGISMSGLAQMAKNMGFNVSGSDLKKGERTESLEKIGIKVNIGHHAHNITKNIQKVVITGAIREDNEEFIKAKSLNVPVITRSEFLSEISQNYKHVIAVSGTHGKTTTTTLLTEIFEAAGKKPTAHVGGIMKKFGDTVLFGGSEFFITEACEYQDAFLSLKPELGIILNIESDHLDYFKTFENVKKSFNTFALQSNKVLAHVSCRSQIYVNNSQFYGEDGNYELKHIEKTMKGYSFDFFKNGKLIKRFDSTMIGENNIKNALAALAVADIYEIPLEVVGEILVNFQGVKRRFEKVGEFLNIPVIHDYAHHPTEIFGALKAFDGKNIALVFQPHTFSRTAGLWEDFIEVLKIPDATFLFKTYSAREIPEMGKSAEELYEVLAKQKQKIFYFEDYSTMQEAIKGLKNIDLILVLGAGDIDAFANFLAAKQS